MDQNSKSEHIEVIKKQIDEVLDEIAKIKNQTAKLRSPTDLERLEKDIAKATDRLAGLLTAKAIQESLDSDALSQQSRELVKNLPQKMESQGVRDVTITPAKGGPLTVKASYYSKKNKRKKKKKS